jgi:dUTP pyrophosphatase
MQLRIKKQFSDAQLPTRAKPGDSGLDLCAYLPEGPVVVRAGDRKKVDTGICIELPPPHFMSDIPGAPEVGWEAQVRPRSGLATNHGIQTAFGTIDNGYRGPVGVTLFNMSFRDFTVRHGDRIAQLVVAPVAYPEVVEVEALTETERGASGFGSTGV